jgi:hypothetical protein
VHPDPHQVVILSRKVSGPQGGVTAMFMANVNVAPRSHSVFKDDEWHTASCVGDESDADRSSRYLVVSYLIARLAGAARARRM